MWWAAVIVCRQSEPSSVASNSEAIIKHEMLDGSLTSRVFDKILMWSSYSIFDTHTHPFNGPFSGTTRVSRYQKGKTNLDFTEARNSEWQWHQHMHMFFFVFNYPE